MARRNGVYQLIADRILTLLEQGVVPWQQPWAGGWPRNLVSSRPYRGINIFLLGCQSYTSPYWLSFPRQVNDRGGRLRRGERVTSVVFWKPLGVTPQEAHNQEALESVTTRIPVLRWYKVVNVEQCTGIEVPTPPERIFEPLVACDQVVEAMPQCPTIVHQGFQAWYAPSTDTIQMPVPKSFQKSEAYYSTLFHELTHATGHTSRLNRPTLTDLCPFGTTHYSKEELVAEMGAAFLCGHTGIANTTIEDSAAYIASWMARLRNDTTLVVQAAAQAQKAVDCILGQAEPRSEPVTRIESEANGMEV